MSCVHFQSILHSILVDQVVEAIDSVWTLSRTQQVHRNKEVLEICFQQNMHNKEMIIDHGDLRTWVDIVRGQVWAVERRLGILGSTSSTRGSLERNIVRNCGITKLSSHVNWSLDKGFWGRGHNIRKVLIRVVEVPLGELVEVAVGVRWERVIVFNHPEESR